MSYVDGFVAAVPTANKDAYLALAKEASAIFREYGATEVVECWGDDVPEGKVTDFRRAVKAEANETIVFSWIVWPSKEARDVGNKKCQDDPRMKMEGAPFDGKRMIYGGFQPILEDRK